MSHDTPGSGLRLDFENVLFVSSGDREEDAREAARIRRELAREAEGLCPNGCAPLTWPKYDDVAECPSCGFVGVGFDKARFPQGREENDGTK